MNVQDKVEDNIIENEYETLLFDNYTLNQIKKAAEENKSIKNLVIQKKKDKIIVYDKEDYSKYCIIFLEPITAKYCIKSNNNNILESENIISTIQIDKKILNYTVKDILFSINDSDIKYNYNSEKIILENISIKRINIIIYIYEKYVYLGDNSILLNDDKINKNDLSFYFEQYFPYYNYETFDYYNGENRENLKTLLKIFLMSLDINFLKICGPSHNGKSTTLLKFSREHANIVYLNLKALMNIKSNDKEKINFQSIIFYELNRIILNKNEGNIFTNFYNEKTFNTPSELIYEIIKFFINKKVVFIFDQFKSNNFDSIQYDKIKKIVLGSKIKIILCCSIDDGPIRDELIHSIKINKGNPKKLTKDTQMYFFYFSYLFDSDLLINLYEQNKYDERKLTIYKKFNYDLKYKNLFDNNNDERKVFDKVLNDIKRKIKENFSIESEQIFYTLSSKIGKELYYENPYDFETLFFVPFKYYNLALKDKYFIINYKYPFIQDIAMKWPKEKDIEDYFINKKYNDELYKRFKGDYFEDFVKIYINKKKDILFEKKLTNNLMVDSIVNMDDVGREGLNICKKKDILSLDDEPEDNEIKNLINNELSHIPNKDDYQDIHYYYKLSLENKKNDKTFLGKKRNKINKYSEEFKNEGILIDQKNRNGETLDQAVLYGEKDKKIFIGLQMKFYSEKTKIDKDEQKKFEKNSIKNKLKNILSNAKINFDINISEWHYIMIIYFNQNDEDNKYGKNLVKLCKKFNLEYIFFNPCEKKFYNSNFEKIEKISITNKSNLDLDININPYLIFKSFCDFDKNIINSIDFEIFDCTSNKLAIEIKKLSEKIKIKDISVFIRTLENNLELKNIKIIGMIKCKMALFPKEKYGYFITTKDNNILLCYNNNNFIIYYDYLNNKKMEQNEFFKFKNDNQLYIIECSYY